jgi:hypothetical protein
MSGKKRAADTLAQTDERPEDIAASLERFAEAASVLSQTHPRLIHDYPDQWVAVRDNHVLAHGDSIESVLREVDAKGIDRASVIVRLIEKKPRTFIL